MSYTSMEYCLYLYEMSCISEYDPYIYDLYLYGMSCISEYDLYVYVYLWNVMYTQGLCWISNILTSMECYTADCR